MVRIGYIFTNFSFSFRDISKKTTEITFDLYDALKTPEGIIKDFCCFNCFLYR